MRKSEIKRRTSETEIELELNLDGNGDYEVETGLGFFDHMLSLWAKHGSFDFKVIAKGDLHVDAHHTVEDTGICLGEAIKGALGAKEGIMRYGYAVVPMDEALAMVAVDVSGRGMLVYKADIPSFKAGGFDTELTSEFFRAVAVNAGITLHVRLLEGINAHHSIEAMFKSFGQALRRAVGRSQSGGGVPSTKGVL